MKYKMGDAKMIYHNRKNQPVGELIDGIFRKVVKGSSHKMKIYNAYGIDSNIFKDLEGNCKEIRIKDTETGQVYRTTYDNFNEHKIEADFDGKQVFLPLKHWNLTDDLTKSML